MSAQVKWTGLRELITELTNAPAEIRADGMDIMRDEVEGAAAEIRNAYPMEPDGSGKLKRGVKVNYPSSQILVGEVRSMAPHSHLYEFGTQQRNTASGASRGVMHGRTGGGGKPVTVPIAKRRRRQMFERLKDMLTRKGYEVSG